MQTIVNLFKQPRRFFLAVLRKSWFLYPDRLFLRLLFYLKTGKILHLNSPRTFNEKLQWLKINNRNPEYKKMVDKYAVKEYVADIIGKEYIIPTLGVWEKPEDIGWDNLPNKFVLKTTHGGGGVGVVVCKDKRTIDRKRVVEKLNRSLKTDVYKLYREWPYKNVPKRIIAEQYLEPDPQVKDLPDYKFLCFNGEPHIIQLDFDRFNGHKKNLYSPDWKLLPFGFNFPSHPEIRFEKPQKLDEMLEIARKISKGHRFLRVDLYWTGEKIYFGEITFFPASGLGVFTPREWDEKVGDLIKL